MHSATIRITLRPIFAVDMLVETALSVTPKGIGMYIKNLGKLIMKGLGKSNEMATNAIRIIRVSVINFV